MSRTLSRPKSMSRSCSLRLTTAGTETTQQSRSPLGYFREPPLRRRDPDARLVDPGFPRKPRVIGAADWTTGAREKHRAAPKALAISLDTGGNRVSGLRTFDHDHSHVALPCSLQKSTGRLECASCQCGVLGGIRNLLIEHGAVGGVLAQLGVLQPAGSLLKRIWM